MQLSDYQLSLHPRFDDDAGKVDYYQRRWESALEDSVCDSETYENTRIALYFCYLDLVIAECEVLVESDQLLREVNEYVSYLHATYAILKCYTMLDEIRDICESSAQHDLFNWYKIRNPLS